ncbi:MAG: M14 family metallopeptidase [Proteobacteria bacterium]|nr:M14 family metallopeptidase [Pseudomonadota bacterium]
MIGVVEAFSPSYAIARQKFLEACMAAGLRAQAFAHPLKGRDGEALAMDVALDGPADAKHLLMVSSACHGVEGHCGSGVQVFALHDQEWRSKAREAGVAVLYVHALNPHGFSHRRRVTHENVDLNRNFFDFSKPLPVNADYAQLHELLLPPTWPPTAQNQNAIDGWIETHGIKAYQTAVTAGQYQFSDGMFFGGNAPTWSNQTLRRILREHAQAARGMAWIDLHTGLGPNGHGERIFACKDDKAAYARANAWWGAEHAVTSIYDGSSTSALLNGLMWNSIYEECPQAEFTAIALEYGTLPILEVTGALRADHWMHKYSGKASAELTASIREQMLPAFYTDTDSWKGQIISQARQAMFQAVDGLTQG